MRSTTQRGIAALVLGVPLSLALYFHPNWTMWFGIPVPDDMAVQLVELLRDVRRQIGDIPPATED